MTDQAISVCIATHEREELLAGTLESLGRQAQSPAEVVVSDSSVGDAVRAVVEGFSSRHPEIRVRHARSDRKSLPWQRWWAFSHSSGSIVLFLDDDVRLDPQALKVLFGAYRDLLGFRSIGGGNRFRHVLERRGPAGS